MDFESLADSDYQRGSNKKSKSKQRILSAALNMFVNKGYFNTKVPDISKEANCSVGSIYHHFASKEKIAEELFQTGIEMFRVELYETILECNSTEEIVKTSVTAFLEFAENNKTMARYLWLARHIEFISSKQLTVPTSVGFDNLGRFLTRTLRRGIKQGEIEPLRAEVLWALIFGTQISFIRDWFDGYTRISPKEIAPVLANRCWIAVKAN